VLVLAYEMVRLCVAPSESYTVRELLSAVPTESCNTLELVVNPVGPVMFSCVPETVAEIPVSPVLPPATAVANAVFTSAAYVANDSPATTVGATKAGVPAVAPLIVKAVPVFTVPFVSKL